QGQSLNFDKTVPPSDPYAPGLTEAFYQWAYSGNVLGHVRDLGFPVADDLFAIPTHVFADPAFNPWLANSDVTAPVRKSTGQFYASWGDLLRAYDTAYKGLGKPTNLRTVNHWFDRAADDSSGEGYPHIWRGAASYANGLTIDGLSGAAAYKWI